MTISQPIKIFIVGLSIIVSLASAAQAGRPLIHSEKVCKAVAKHYGKKWGGSGNYKTKGCYYYENGKYSGKVYYGKGGVLWSQNANTGDGKSRNGKRRFDQLCRIPGGRMNNGKYNKVPSPGPRADYDLRPLLFHIKCDCGNDEGEMFGFDSCR